LAERLSQKGLAFVKTRSEKKLLESLVEAAVYGDFGLTVEQLGKSGKVAPATVNRFLAKIKKNRVLRITRFGKDYFLFPMANTSL
jgi:3'-phosphoadenosine 5'-phosphosulfate sulfotransferase